MASHLNNLQETIFSVREKLTDNEYLSMMDDLCAIFRKQNEVVRKEEEFTLPDLFERCQCSNAKWYIRSACFQTLEGFLKCDYHREFLERFPLAHFVLSGSGYILPKFKLQGKPVLNFEKKLDDYDKQETLSTISTFITLISQVKDKKYKIYLALELCSFLFSNFKYMEDNQNFKRSFMRKIIHFRENFEPSSLFPENLFLRYDIDD